MEVRPNLASSSIATRSQSPKLKSPELTREECIAQDQRSARDYLLSKLWRDLTQGRASIVDCFYTENRCFVVLAPAARPLRQDRRLASRKISVLERVLLGEGQKAVALSLGLAPSTVTLIAAECLSAMGLDCPASRVPMVLALAAHAEAYGTGRFEGRATDIIRSGSALRVVSAARPDDTLSALLSPAECEVARLLIESRRHVEIAGLRRTSTRTIANQLAAVFHKLGVSGRAELLSRICRATLLSLPSEGEGAGVAGLVLASRVSARLGSRSPCAESLPAA